MTLLHLTTHRQKDENFGAPWICCLFAAITQWEFPCISPISKRTQVQAHGIQFFKSDIRTQKPLQPWPVQQPLFCSQLPLKLLASTNTWMLVHRQEQSPAGKSSFICSRQWPAGAQLVGQISLSAWPPCFRAEAKDKVQSEITMPNFHCFHGGVCTDYVSKILVLSTENW